MEPESVARSETKHNHKINGGIKVERSRPGAGLHGAYTERTTTHTQVYVVFITIKLLQCKVWYGTVWYGMVWYGTVWYGMVR